MKKFKTYLKDTRAAFLRADASLNLVMGNTSGDMDSIVGALGLAYYLTLKTNTQWTPVVNCKRNELKLKVEIFQHLIVDCEISLDDMIFWDELSPLKVSINEICLIDHNKIDSS
jgi:inorganic pyrophosphatase/exopolyphosphatase